MTSTTPDYNLSNPPTLYAAGTLNGSPVNLDPTSCHPLDGDGAVLKGRLTVPLSKTIAQGGERDWVCVKRVEEGGGRWPRDVKREIRLLQEMIHENILPLLSAYLLPSESTPTRFYTLFTPFYPLPLWDILNCPLLVPPTPGFDLIVHSLAHQLISAVAYLHAQEPPIAHRDLSRGNVVIGAQGRVVLCDFGLSVREGDEKDGEMEFDFGTQPYRPPELIFSSRSYHPSSLDLWSLGCLLSEFFLPLSASSSSPPSSLDSEEARWKAQMSDEEEEDRTPKRETLFDGTRTDFALTGSIFKLLGTPTAESWPESSRCPSFTHFRFAPFPRQPLSTRLPHLPSSSSSPLPDLLEGLLQISVAQRLTAEECLDEERWRGVELLEPTDLGGGSAQAGGEEVQGKTLGQLLRGIVQ